MKKTLTALLLAALLLALTACELFEREEVSQTNWDAEQPLLVCEEGSSIMQLGSTLQAGEKSSTTAEITLTGPTAFFSIERDSQDGLKVNGVAGSKGQNFADDFDLSGALDEYGDLTAHYMVQITTYDFDKDGQLEVVVCVGDRATQMQLLVYSHIGGEVPFELVGAVAGQIQMTIEGQQILVPNTDASLGRKYEYTPDAIVDA